MFNLTRAGYYADFALLPALVLLLLAWHFGAALIWCFGGFMAWTLAEYLIHRFVFHHVPLLRRDHDRHHREPSAYIGAGSWITLPIFGLLWLGARWLLGGGAAMQSRSALLLVITSTSPCMTNSIMRGPGPAIGFIQRSTGTRCTTARTRSISA